MVKIVMKIIPDGQKKVYSNAEPQFLDSKLVSQPTAALQLVVKEVARCIELVSDNLKELIAVSTESDSEKIKAVIQNSEDTRKLYERITEYLSELFASGGLTEEQANQTAGIMYILSDVDRMSALCREVCLSLKDKEEKKYTKAYKEFEKLAPYKKSKQEMKDCTYLNAKEELRNNPTSDVYFTLVDLGDYKNSKKLSEHAFNSCKDDIYDTAIRRYEDGRFEEALSLFEGFGEYKDTQQYIEYCNLMIRFQGAYKSTLSKNDSKVLNGWKLTTYDMDAWNASGVSKDEEYLTLTKDENQYYMYEKQYSSVTEAFSVYALIETDDKTSQGIDEIYTGKDLDVLYKKDSSINERTLEEGYDKEISRPDPQIGMTKEEVRESTWGEPKRIHKTSNTYGITEQWVYEYHKYIYFDDGIVTSIQE